MFNSLFKYLSRRFHQWGSPKYFYEYASRWLPWLAFFSTMILMFGLVWGLAFAPPDYQQGDSFRIIYIHVPAASLGMSIYVFMAIASVVSWVWKIKLADMLAKSCAPLGAVFTAIALITGAIWGKPTWGTWWEWDARLTSMLILFFLYMGIIALRSAINQREIAAQATGVLALVGLINLPIIKYSVDWWNTLHQSATFKLLEKPAMPPEMWLPLLISLLGFYCLFAWLVLFYTRNEILEREAKSQWLRAQVLK